MIIRHLLALFVLAAITSQPGQATAQKGTVYDFPVSPMATADGRTSATSLKPYKGKVLLIVNVASKCGFTPQYAQLEQVYNRYKDRGLVVLAFPSNQFGGQEPGSDAEIAQFCQDRFNVTFPVFSKTDVKGDSAAPLFQFLTQGDHPARNAISWNFNKFLVGRDGRPIAHFSSMVRPDSRSMIDAIEAALGQ